MGYLQNAVTKALAKAGYAPASQVQTIYRYDTRRDRQGTPNERGGGNLTFHELRQFTDQCDPVRNAISVRQAQVLMTPLSFRKRDGIELSVDEERARLALAEEFTTTEGILGGPGTSWHEWVSKTTEDLFCCGATAQYRRRGRGGQVIGVEPVDVSTIKPLVNPDGWTITGKEIAFEQWINGRKVADFAADDMHYRRLFPRTSSRWGRSPVEFVARAVEQFLGYDDWNMAWIVDGDGDFGHWAGPANSTPEERKQFDAFIRQQNETMDKRVRGARMALPSGWEFHPRRTRAEAEFEKTQTFLIRRICAAFQLSAALIGFAGEHYKVSQEEQRKVAEDFGERVFKLLLADLINDILRYDRGVTDMEAYWDDDEEDLEKNARVVSAAGTGVYTPNQARRIMGEPPMQGPWVDKLFIVSPTGPILVGWDPEALPNGPGEEMDAADNGQPEQEVQDEQTSEAGGQPNSDATSAEDTSPADSLTKMSEEARKALSLWRTKALRAMKTSGLEKAIHCGFVSEHLSPQVCATVSSNLAKATDAEGIRAAFSVESDIPDVPRLVGDLEKLLSVVQSERSERRKEAVPCLR